MVTDWKSTPPIVRGLSATGCHTTDDGETTTCAAYFVDDLPDGETIIEYPDDRPTCPVCKAIENLVIKGATRVKPDS